MSFVWSLAKFERCCEFSKLRGGHAVDAQKYTKALLLAMALELHPLRFELQIWLSLIVGTLMNSQSFIFGDSNIQMRTFLTWDFFYMLLFFSGKNQDLLDIHEHCICKLGKIRSELKLFFGVHYWFLKLYTGIIWELLPFTRDFIAKGQRRVWGQVG